MNRALQTVEEQEFAAELGAWIVRLRQRFHLSTAYLGKVAGVHRNTVRRWELGESVPDAFQHSRLKALEDVRKSMLRKKA